MIAKRDILRSMGHGTSKIFSMGHGSFLLVPGNRGQPSQALQGKLLFSWDSAILLTIQFLQCSCCYHLEHPAPCRLNLDHDENSGNLYEKWERRFPIRNIYQSQQRKYNRKRIDAMAVILTTKTAIDHGTIFLHNLWLLNSKRRYCEQIWHFCSCWAMKKTTI